MKQILLLLSAIMTALTGAVGGGRAQARAEVAGAGFAIVQAVARTIAPRGVRPAGETIGFVLRLATFSIARAEPVWAGRRRL